MRLLTLLTLLTLMLAASLAVPPAVRAATDIRIDPDYDPRIDLRVVVLPAEKDRSLRRVNERTVSAMFATELLRLYEVLDLLRFEQVLQERRFKLDNAFSEKARETVRDVTGVDAIASVEIYRWQEGTGGIPFLSRKSGRIGARVRLMDPYTGRIYWSVNRLEKVKPGADFLDRATLLFRDVILELDGELADIAADLNEYDSHAEMLAARGEWPRLQSGAAGRLEQERGFIPRMTPEAAFLAAYRGYGYLPEGTRADDFRSPDAAFEDIETEGKALLPKLGTVLPPQSKTQRQTLTGTKPGELRESANYPNPPTLPRYEHLDAPSDTTKQTTNMEVVE